MALGRNVAANVFGQLVKVVTGVLFVPIYVRHLGVESYGLIGMFAVLQAWLVLLDFGLRPALSREMARFTGGAHSLEWIRDLLRTVEVLGVSISIFVALAVGLSAPWLATRWVTATTLPASTVIAAFVLMGVVTALRFVENIYTSSLVGLQRQVLETLISSVSAIVRGVGAIAILAFVSPTIEAFFIWQCVTSIATVLVLAVSVYWVLPRGERRSRFDRATLSSVRTFAVGVLVLSFQSLILTNLDKLLLSRFLSLKEFGSYALIGVVANALAMLTQPVVSALTPRLTEVATRDKDGELGGVYLLATQGVSMLSGSAAMILIAFSERVLVLWTKDPALAGSMASLMMLMVFGSLLNALGYMPYHLQLATGWTSLSMRYNAALIVALVPALWLLVPRYGAFGAAWAWAVLNAAYLIVNVPLMHRRLLRDQLSAWYRAAFAPLTVAALTAFALSRVVPRFDSRLAELLAIGSASAVTLCLSLVAAPRLRAHVVAILRTRGHPGPSHRIERAP